MTRRAHKRICDALARKSRKAGLILLKLKEPGKLATKQEVENYNSQLSQLLQYRNEISDLLLLVKLSRNDADDMLVNAYPSPTFKIVNHRTFEKVASAAKSNRYLYDGESCKCISVPKSFNRVIHYIYTPDAETITCA